MIAKLDAAELQRWLREKRSFSLIDVLPEEYFNEQHLPGAQRACVYEVDFLEQVNKLGLAADDAIVLYGAGRGSLDSAVAAEKLERAGFTQVFDFRGGRAAWKESGGVFEGNGERSPAPRAPDDRTYSVDSERSSIEWIGRNLNSTHRGTIRIAQGSLVLRGSQLESGRISIDMSSIENTDIADHALRGVLEAHLKSDDFFDVERFPSAELTIQSASPQTDATPGTPNQRLAGELTIKGFTHPIEFPAIVSLGDDGALTAVAQLEIDRTRWNVLYGSGRFFQMLGKHLVNDAVTLLVKIIAQ
ncbi:MAG: YceI family protein [Verrucomicrobiales bacterium]